MISISLEKEQPVNYPPVNELIIKLASRCNIICSYCYWFNDPLVMKSPKILQPDAENALVLKLREHIQSHELKKFYITFHGGEPTLFPKNRFASLCHSILSIEAKTHCRIYLSMQSNGLLIDDDWIQLLRKYKVNLGISLDGDQFLHDKYRIDVKGRGTYLKTVEAIDRIRASGIAVYILSVAAPQMDANELLVHFVEKLGLKHFDVLVPHLHHENDAPSLKEYFCVLFDRYMDELIDKDVSIRVLNTYMKQIVAGSQHSTQDLGHITTVTLLTDGKLEATDDLRVVDNLIPSNIKVQTHDLQQVTEDPLWQEIYNASFNLPAHCRSCEFEKICGGGPMATRWSDENRFNNPSVYCKDFKAIISHIKQRLEPHIKRLRPEVEGASC